MELYFLTIDGKNNTDDLPDKPQKLPFKLLMVYVTTDLSKILASMFLQRKVYVMFFGDENVELPQLLTESYYFWEQSVALSSITKVLIHAVQLYKWQFIGIFYFYRPSAEIYSAIYFDFLEEIRRSKTICYFNEEFDVKNSSRRNNVIANLIASNAKVVFLFGSPSDQRFFLRKILDLQLYGRRIIWILQDVPEDAPVMFYASFNSLERTRLYSNLKRFKNHPVLSELLTSSRNISHDKYIIQRKMILYLSSLKIFYDVSRKSTIFYKTNYMASSLFILGKVFVNFKNGPSYLKIPGKHILIDQSAVNFFTGTACSNVTCSVGHSPYFGRLLPYQTTWNSSFGNTCRKCPSNYIQPFRGNFQCIKCPKYHKSNAFRTKCYDPFINVMIIADTFETNISIALSVFGIVTVFFMLSIIILKKSSPICKTMDVNITVAHILILGTIYLVFPMMFFHFRPSQMTCLLQPFFISVPYSMNLGLIYIRSHKLLSLFCDGRQSFKRVSKKQKILTSIEQGCIVSFYVFVSLGVVYISYNTKKPDVYFELDFITFHRRSICNTNFHINCLVVALIFGHLICAIPAFRSRKLPSVFREAMMIVYISFICVVSFGVMFPINVFQERLEHKTNLHWIVFHVNTIVVLLILYGWKCFVMIFQPHKNTRLYVMSSMRPDVLTTQ